ncbi:MAG TPA: SDR family NAD(P)-dependent oxidoreductase [Candidatus Limnocylindrales bacterium]|nr:SDR family NAD(P)-dependent oxidoreductase [Candidatus Limnocylindrales bacterium]
MDLGLVGKVAFITGGASGLGKCTAEMMAAEGVSVMLADVNEGMLESTRAALAGTGAQVEAVRLDVRDLGACRKAIDGTIARFGKLDILVNSAGIGGSASFFVQTDPEEWQDLIGINLLGVMNCCRAASDHMIERRYGKIVSIASEAGRANEKRMVVYGATKGGVISLTRGLALELGRYSINVNAVCPGVTKTPMTAYIDEEMEKQASRFYPLGRLGVPEDIAPMITFLASDRASWITGQAISVSGGFGRA